MKKLIPLAQVEQLIDEMQEECLQLKPWEWGLSKRDALQDFKSMLSSLPTEESGWIGRNLDPKRAYNSLVVNVGDKYWIWEIIEEVEKHGKLRQFMCKCECWNVVKIKLKSLRRWEPHSCWCKKNNGATTHWMRWTPLYKKWQYMRERCSANAPHKAKCYKDRWITVCEDWNDFMRFYEDMKEWFSPDLELDRIDNDKWYFKENCRWVTKAENIKNRRKKSPLPKPPLQ